VIDSEGFEGGKHELGGWFESYNLIGRVKGHGRSDHDMRTATEAGVFGAAVLVGRHARNLARDVGIDFAGNQLYTCEEEDDHC